MADDVQYLTDQEIKEFLDDLDHNGDGIIDYSEVESKLDAVHKELVPDPKPHNLNHDAATNLDRDKDRRHGFLRSIIGSDKQRIPRDEFAARVKEWKIPSMKKEKDKEASQRQYVKSMKLWRRARAYWAVHGPEIAFLGLVVGMQLAFGIWQFVKYLTGPYTGGFGWGVVLAKTCAGALYPTFFFLILSMSRYFSTFLRRSYYVSRFINWDLSQDFHIRISIVAICLATLHAIGHLSGSFNWGSRPENEGRVEALLGPGTVPRPYIRYIQSLPGWTGLTALGLFYTLSLMSIPQIRRWNYEVFQLAHLLMYPIIGLLMAHGTAGLLQWPMFGYFLAFPTLLIFTERLVRIGTGLHHLPATIKSLDKETVEIRATIPSERIWTYQAGQYVFLQVPQLSMFQWHPFTVSICIGKEMRLHIKTDGNWTKRLQTLIPEGQSSAEIKIGINGPFGAPAQRFYDFTHTIIVGAGIGVTPFSGILADLQSKDDKDHGGPTHSSEEEPGTLLEKVARRDSNESPAPVNTNGVPAESSSDNTTPVADQDDTQPMAKKSATMPPVSYAPDYRRVDFHWTVRDRNYLLWLSDLLNAVSRSQLWHANHDEQPHLDVRIATHVTQSRKGIATHVYRWLLEKHRTPEHPESPLTGLLNPTHYGRPDFEKILEEHYEDMVKYKRALVERDPDEWEDEEFKVGVFFCGTPVVGEILADQCRLLSARGRHDGTRIEYHFMIEVFG